MEAGKHLADYFRTLRALKAAMAKLGSAFYGSHYVIQYGAQLITLRRVLQIHADPTIPDGTMVKPAPEKRIPTKESLRALFDDEVTLEETLIAVKELLTNSGAASVAQTN